MMVQANCRASGIKLGRSSAIKPGRPNRRAHSPWIQAAAEAAAKGEELHGLRVLRRYERWRRFDSFSSAAAFDGLNRLFSNDSLLMRAARDVGLGLVDRLPGVKQRLVAEAAGLTGDLPRLFKSERL